MSRKIIFAGTGVLLLLALAHAFFAADIAYRVWGSRMHFEAPGEAMLLVALELARATAILVATAGVLMVARGAEPYRPLLALAFAAVAVWYGAAFTFPAVAGYAQGIFATWLRAMNVPDRVLATVFVDGGWALWIGVAAALRSAALLLTAAGRTPDEIRADDTGRPGLLRDSHVAGADVGRAFRGAAAAAVERGWLEARVVWAVAAAMVVLHVILPSGMQLALTLAFIAIAAVAFTLLRTALRRGGDRERGILRWLALGAGLAAAGYMAGGGFALLSPPGMMLPTFVIMATTPLAVALCLARAARA